MPDRPEIRGDVAKWPLANSRVNGDKLLAYEKIALPARKSSSCVLNCGFVGLWDQSMRFCLLSCVEYDAMGRKGNERGRKKKIGIRGE